MRKFLWSLFLVFVGGIATLALDVVFREPMERLKWGVERLWNPLMVVFETSSVSGCTPLTPLLKTGSGEGLTFDPVVGLVRVCDYRHFEGSARRILEDIGKGFHRCFMFDESNKMQVQTSSDQICKANFRIDPATNGWIEARDGTLLCFPESKRIPGPLQTNGIPARLCPNAELKRLGFPVR
jgi:hypothetical protein